MRVRFRMQFEFKGYDYLKGDRFMVGMRVHIGIQTGMSRLLEQVSNGADDDHAS